MRSLIRWTVFLSLAPAVFVFLVALAVCLTTIFVVRGMATYAENLAPPTDRGPAP
jgi:hypothetical protein